MISHVSLKNWKSHEETELDFSQGTNVLVGIMGSGKSAVLEAITYGLFGTTPGVKSRNIVLDDLIKNRPVVEDTAEVEITFKTSKREEYKVKRILEREKGTTYAELRKSDGELIDKPNSTSVTEHITSLLQLDYDFFERMIYAKQNHLDNFLTLEPRERRKKIDELLKINKFERARKNTTTLINRIKDRAGDRREDLEELKKDEDLGSLPRLVEELEETKKEKEELLEKQEEIEPRIEEVEKKLGEFEDIKKKIEDLSRKDESLSGKIETHEEQISKIEDRLDDKVDSNLEDLKHRKTDLKNKLNKSKERADDLDSKSDSITSKLSQIRTEVKTIRKGIKELEEEIKKKERKKEELDSIDLDQINEDLEGLKKRREGLRDKLSSKKVSSKNLEESLEELRGAESKCPVCDRPLDDEMKEKLIQEREQSLEDYEKKISKLKHEIDGVKDKIDEKNELKEKARKLKNRVKDLPDLKSELSESREKLESKTDRLEKVKGKKSEIRELLKKSREKTEKIQKDYEEVKNDIGLLEDLESARKDKEKAEEKRDEIRKKLSEKRKDYDKDLVEELEQKHQDLIKKQEHYKTRLSEIKKLIEQKEKLVESVKKKKQTLDWLEVEVKVLKDSVSSLNKIREALSKSQVSLRKQVMEAVNDMMNDIWTEIYPYDDFTRIRLSIEEKGKISDYELQMMDSSGSWNPVEGVTSGGERTCASLTLRIAFAVVLAPNLSWLVLDEPTHNLDSEGIDNLSEILRERIPKVVDQIILITHEKQLESAVSGHLYRFSRDKNRDGPTEVERVQQGL